MGRLRRGLCRKSRLHHEAKSDAGRKGIHQEAGHRLPKGLRLATAWLGISTAAVQRRMQIRALCRPLRPGGGERVAPDDPKGQAVMSHRSGSRRTH